MSVVDWERLHELRSDIGEEDFADVAFLFVAELQEHVDRMSNAPGDVRAADFHFLRGSAANLGLVALVNACTAAEAACNGGQTPDVPGVRLAFEAAMAELGTEIAEIHAA